MRNWKKAATWFSVIEASHCGRKLTKIKTKPAVRTKREEDCHSVSFLKTIHTLTLMPYSDHPSKSDPLCESCSESRGICWEETILQYSVRTGFEGLSCFKVTYILKTCPQLRHDQCVSLPPFAHRLRGCNSSQRFSFFLNWSFKAMTRHRCSRRRRAVLPHLHCFAPSNGLLQLVSAACHLHDQHGGMQVLDCRPLCCISEDFVPFWLQLCCRSPLCDCFNNELISVKKMYIWEGAVRINVLDLSLTSQGDWKFSGRECFTVPNIANVVQGIHILWVQFLRSQNKQVNP
jgi:hypothetical protein